MLGHRISASRVREMANGRRLVAAQQAAGDRFARSLEQRPEGHRVAGRNAMAAPPVCRRKALYQELRRHLGDGSGHVMRSLWRQIHRLAPEKREHPDPRARNRSARTFQTPFARILETRSEIPVVADASPPERVSSNG
jgi:hypothetical protein